MPTNLLKIIFCSCLCLSSAISADKGSKAGEREIVIRQQRELEADSLILKANKAHKVGDYELAASIYKKAIDRYEKSSISEKRITKKINLSYALLANIYKIFAEKTLKKADQTKSVMLYDKAEQLFIKSKKAAQKIKKT
jgi:tetratricopeptide (TPR) repeat protein